MSEPIDRKARYSKLIDEFMRDDAKLASSADEKCQKIYDHMRILVSEKEAILAQISESNNKEEKKSLKKEIAKIDNETNELLNILSHHSMQF